MKIHIFWDNSNVWGGLQELQAQKEPDVNWVALRAHFKNIDKLVTKDREVETRVMAGSVPPQCESLWTHAERLGYNTDLLHRIGDDEGGTKEQGVDELLHLKISNAILDFDAPQTLIILSGDGKGSDFGTSFPKQVERALRHDWNVEIYSTSLSFGKRYYKELEEKYGEKLQLIELDEYYENLTFIKAGKYYTKDGNGHKTYYTVERRVAKDLL